TEFAARGTRQSIRNEQPDAETAESFDRTEFGKFRKDQIHPRRFAMIGSEPIESFVLFRIGKCLGFDGRHKSHFDTKQFPQPRLIRNEHRFFYVRQHMRMMEKEREFFVYHIERNVTKIEVTDLIEK